MRSAKLMGFAAKIMADFRNVAVEKFFPFALQELQ
jgi:hypothetical protein